MRLSLKNIGKVKNATIDINGITVITGKNNTGKSTVSKVLFSVFNSFYAIEQRIVSERASNIEGVIRNTINKTSRERILFLRVDTEEFVDRLLSDVEKYLSNIETLHQELVDFMIENNVLNESEAQEKTDKIKNASKEMLAIMDVSNDDIIKTILRKQLVHEFNGQINNIYNMEEGLIELTIQNETVSAEIQDNQVKGLHNRFILIKEAIYIDDPFVIDEDSDIRRFRSINRAKKLDYQDHRDHLKSKLYDNAAESNVIGEIIAGNKLERVLSKIGNICTGVVVKSKDAGIGYRESGSEKSIDMKNISAGLKPFIIIKELLLNGTLGDNGTLILDEPEIHLHPEWQLVFAELIVLIQKEFGMHILLNTHSPYFLNAIEVYAARHEIADKCIYYLASDEGELSEITDVSNEIEKIYSKFARPLQKLENERYDDNQCR